MPILPIWFFNFYFSKIKWYSFSLDLSFAVTYVGKIYWKCLISLQPYNYFTQVLLMVKNKKFLLTSLHNWEELVSLILAHTMRRLIFGVENNHEEIFLTDLIIPFLLVISFTHSTKLNSVQNNKIVFNDISWKISVYHS